jgi:hypothetical protein
MRMTRFFSYAIDGRYLPLLVPFGFRRHKSGVTLSGDSFLATFGFFKLSTSLTILRGRISLETIAGGRRLASAYQALTTG